MLFRIPSSYSFRRVVGRYLGLDPGHDHGLDRVDRVIKSPVKIIEVGYNRDNFPRIVVSASLSVEVSIVIKPDIAFGASELCGVITSSYEH